MQKIKKLLSFFRAFELKSSRADELNKGFTLLELLIVIAILATLATIVVLVLNPAETLAKSRDTQRMSDMATLKSAIALYTTTVSSVDLDADVTMCFNNNNSTAQISYSSIVASDPSCAVNIVEGSAAYGTYSATDSCRALLTESASAAIDGTGWVPVKLDTIAGGSPLSNLPLDPTNTVITATPSNTMLTYRYACQNTGAGTAAKPSYIFELAAVLESEEYKVSKMKKDGGDNDNYYEVGTNLKLMPPSTNVDF